MAWSRCVFSSFSLTYCRLDTENTEALFRQGRYIQSQKQVTVETRWRMEEKGPQTCLGYGQCSLYRSACWLYAFQCIKNMWNIHIFIYFIYEFMLKWRVHKKGRRDKRATTKVYRKIWLWLYNFYNITKLQYVLGIKLCMII